MWLCGELTYDITTLCDYDYDTNRQKYHSMLRVFQVFITCVALGAAADADTDGIIPDVVYSAGGHDFEVSYPSFGKLETGATLTPRQVHEQPDVDWSAEDSDYYTLVLTDPDAPSRADPSLREYVHWVRTNIPGSDMPNGETLFGYVGAGPPKGTGLHRYAFLLYRQPYGKLEFGEKRHGCGTDTGGVRAKWSARDFALKYNLGDPVGLKYFKAEYDAMSDDIFNACDDANKEL
jgi:hypothetical protein